MLDHKAQGSGRGRPLIGGLIRPIPIETADELFAYVEVLYG